MWLTSAILEMLHFETDQADARLAQALATAMASGIHPSVAAEAANISVSELFDTLRRCGTMPLL
ncbi:hypothetical protein [Arthrobacter sp. TMN-50]